MVPRQEQKGSFTVSQVARTLSHGGDFPSCPEGLRVLCAQKSFNTEVTEIFRALRVKA